MVTLKPSPAILVCISKDNFVPIGGGTGETYVWEENLCIIDGTGEYKVLSIKSEKFKHTLT